LLGKVWGGKYRGQRQKWFLLRYLGTDAQIDIATDHPEFAAWKWIKADQMLAEIVPFKRDVYEQVIAAFRGYLAQ
jgi:putative (di)nucleoside polyphosphate hydrolase